MIQLDDMPDWPPQESARDIPEGTFRRGSTGQQFIAQNGRWVRVHRPAPVTNGTRETEANGER